MTEKIEVPRTCLTCVLCLRSDFGYSNWTCEGTLFFCLAGLNPELDGKEEPWREEDKKNLDPLLDAALTCPRYRFGAPATLDVDREGIPYKEPVTPEMLAKAGYTDDAEAAPLLIEWLGKNE